MRTAAGIALCIVATAAHAETAYHAIALDGGGHIVLRHGDATRVDFIKGDAAHTGVTVRDGMLRIENCRRPCPHGYEMELAVTAHGIDTLSVRDGGTIEARGAFPEQPALALAVSDGGAIDARALTAGDVTASVSQGGGIYAAPRASLAASVSHGGHIDYWGNAKIRQSVADGGVVKPGRAEDATKPLAEIRPKLPPPPAVPKLPALPKPPRN